MKRRDEVTNTYMPAKTPGICKLIISNLSGDTDFFFNADYRKFVEREKWYLQFRKDRHYDERVPHAMTWTSSAENQLEIFPPTSAPGSGVSLFRFIAQCAFPKKEIKSTRLKLFGKGLGSRNFDDYRDPYIDVKLRESRNGRYYAIPELVVAQERIRRRTPEEAKAEILQSSDL